MIFENKFTDTNHNTQFMDAVTLGGSSQGHCASCTRLCFLIVFVPHEARVQQQTNECVCVLLAYAPFCICVLSLIRRIPTICLRLNLVVDRVRELPMCVCVCVTVLLLSMPRDDIHAYLQSIQLSKQISCDTLTGRQSDEVSPSTVSITGTDWDVVFGWTIYA